MSEGALALGGELLERDQTFAVLDGLLVGVGAGRTGRLVWVCGEAGVWEDGPAARFCARQDKPVRVLWGACESLLTPHPLGPVLDIAEACGGELEELVERGAALRGGRWPGARAARAGTDDPRPGRRALG